MGRSNFDEVSEVGSLYFSGCTPIKPNGIQIEISEAYDDSDIERNAVLIEMHGGSHGFSISLSPDEAEALAAILRHTAKEVRRMTEAAREPNDDE